MSPIHDPTGRVIAWLRGSDIFDLTGMPQAFLHDGCVVNYRGKHLGTFDQGYFRDRAGKAVALIEGAMGRPLPPPLMPAPLPPTIDAPPIKPIPPLPPTPPTTLWVWSPRPWDEFVACL